MSRSWKLATFNVNGIRARLPIVTDWLIRHQPDVLCLQEIKSREEDFPREPFAEAGYTITLLGQKGFNGVALLTRRAPLQVLRGFCDGEADEEARLIAALVDGVWVVNSYVVQGRDPEDPAFQRKLAFFRRLRRWLEVNFEPRQPLVWTGDLNVAREEIDVFDPKRMSGKIGFHPEERRALAEVMAWGFTDLFRKHHPEERQFTFWDYRLPSSFLRNLGWRIDLILATESLACRSLDCGVDSEPRGLEKPSDHTPVWAEFDLDGVQ